MTSPGGKSYASCFGLSLKVLLRSWMFRFGLIIELGPAGAGGGAMDDDATGSGAFDAGCAGATQPLGGPIGGAAELLALDNLNFPPKHGSGMLLIGGGLSWISSN